MKPYGTLSMLVLLLAKAHAVDTHMKLTRRYVWAPVAFCAVCCGHGVHLHIWRVRARSEHVGSQACGKLSTRRDTWSEARLLHICGATFNLLPFF